MGFEPKLIDLCGNTSTGSSRVAPAFQAVTTWQNFCKSSDSTSGIHCVEAKMTPKPWLYRKVQGNPLQHGALGLGILSATLLQWTGAFPSCYIFPNVGHTGTKLLKHWVLSVLLEAIASDPPFLCLAPKDILEQRGAGVSSVAGKGRKSHTGCHIWQLASA